MQVQRYCFGAVRIFFGGLLFCWLSALSGFAQDWGGLDEEGEDNGLGLLNNNNDDGGLESLEEGGDEKKPDLAGLADSHFSSITYWKYVKQGRRSKKGAKFHWQARSGWVSPLDKQPITTLIAVPKAGQYRVFLRQQVVVGRQYPVVLTLSPAQPGLILAADATRHTFGQLHFDDTSSGKRQERQLPIRFETETQLIGIPRGRQAVWEYWDVTLPAGKIQFQLSSAERNVRVSALFISRAKAFRPSLAKSLQWRTFNRIYLRFRAIPEQTGARRPVKISANLTYHWRGRAAPHSTEPAWGWRIGTISGFSTGEWSPFLDATDAAVPGPGPWSSCNLSISGVKTGTLEMELAWYPDTQAVIRQISTHIGDSRVRFRMPHGSSLIRPSSKSAVWGMNAPGYLQRLMTEEKVIARYFKWAEDAGKKLGIKPGPDLPRPQKIKIFTGCRVGVANQAHTAEMLAQLGINWIDGAPPEIVKKYDLVNDKSLYHVKNPETLAKRLSRTEIDRITKVKIGDEIRTAVAVSAINSDPAQRQRFYSFLRQQAKDRGQSVFSFLGVDRLEDLSCIATKGTDAGRFERRLFYYSQRFRHLASVPGYRSLTNRIQQCFPHAHVYNNYSPHPVFLTGTTMNNTNWFVLCRNQAQTLGWGEDWAYRGSWSLHTHYWCVSFYTALVDCAVRKYHYPGGFYVGSNCGGSANKIFTCLAQGLTWLHLYDWGPIDGWAEGSNAWSEQPREYYNVMAACYAIGPADTILADGKRAPRRVAILYNRSHEILQGGTGRLNHDWMWTFIALKTAQIPVELIIEEDLNPETLKKYDVLFLGGFNLEKYRLQAVRDWVAAGGMCVGAGGFARFDVAGDLLADTEKLFGTTQAPWEESGLPAPKKIHFKESQAFAPADLTCAKTPCLYKLTPQTSQPIATFDNGACAATYRQVGKGAAILLGFQPGYIFHASKQAQGPGRAWIQTAMTRRLGPPPVSYTGGRDCELTLFTHTSGMAVLINNFSARPEDKGGELTVRATRPVASVRSGLHGPLKWKQEKDRVIISVTPAPMPVDTVILRFR